MDKVSKSTQQLEQRIAQLEQKLAKVEADNGIYREILDKAPMLISAKDLNGTVLMANKRCELIKNTCDENFVGKNVYEAFPKNVADVIWQNDLLALSRNELVETEESIFHGNGEKHVYYTVIFPLADSQNEPFGVGSLSYDITEIKHSVELSITDSLTGLYTWRYFNMRFGGELLRAEKQQTLFTMLLIEIDNFETYKENYGKQWSDDVVITVAGAIQNVCSRSHELCFRFNESRMACLLSMSDYKDAKDIGEEIRHFIASLGIEHEYAPDDKIITISIGLSMINYEDNLEQEQIFSITESALKQAQSKGGNRVIIAHADDIHNL